MSGQAKFAEATSVSVEKTKAEIERTIMRYGADGFGTGWADGRATIQFRIGGRHVRFIMLLPKRGEERFTLSRLNQFQGRARRAPEAALKAWEQACRQKWRAIYLVIKAKLEAVDADILTLEESFLAEIVMPDGKTVWEHTRERIAIAYKRGEPLPLLGGPG